MTFEAVTVQLDKDVQLKEEKQKRKRKKKYRNPFNRENIRTKMT